MKKAEMGWITRDDALKSLLRVSYRDLFYHATSDVYLYRILEHGLCKGSVFGIKQFEGMEDAIFLTTDINEKWAERTVRKVGGKEIYVVVSGREILKSECNVYPDWELPQPLLFKASKREQIYKRYVTDVILLDCDCVKIKEWNFF